jgi:3'-5' exonuclease
LDLLKFLADKDKDLISVYITQLCDKKKWKDAENFIENSNIDPLEFPLILKKATKRSLKFFLYNGVIIKNLMELVELDYIGIAGLIECLVEYGSNPSESWVLKVAEYLLRTNLPCVDIIKPSILDQLPRDQKVIFYPPEDEYGPYEKDCAGMPSSISVLFIDREEHLVELNWEDVKIVALDTEWKTELNKRINNKTSILQIGLPSKVLIIDLIKLSDSQELDNKLFELLGNSKIMKIGIGFDGDIARLKSSYKNMGCFKEPVYNYIDLIHVYKKEKNLNPGGLAGLSEIVLRVPMCKEEQKSNWELRPLRLSQIHYAALDVYICLAIYNEFFETDKIDMEKYSINIPSPHNKDNSVLLPSCNQCGSKIHSINQCKATQRCRFCGFADHSGFECPCFRY